MRISQCFTLTKSLLSAFILSFLFIINANSQSRDDCLMCHEDPDLSIIRNGRTISLFVNTAILDKSVHKDVDCALCHADAAVADYPHAENLAKVSCGTCHEEPDRRFFAGIHGQALKMGDSHAPDCKECHRSESVV